MLTNRCVCCDAILSEYEMKWDELMQDYNDMCNRCLRVARDAQIERMFTVNNLEKVEDENNTDE
jgi:hypothetical protein